MKYLSILKAFFAWTNGKKTATATAAFIIAVGPLLWPELFAGLDPELVNEFVIVIMEGAASLGLFGLLHKLWKAVKEKIAEKKQAEPAEG